MTYGRVAVAFTLSSLAGLAALTVSRSARADELATCVKASEVGQSLRDEGKYLRAREKFLVCSRDVCPAVVRRDCVGWLTEVDTSLPSVVISATDSGHDVSDVKVTIDGTPVVGKLEGKPIPLDPGAHALHYEHAGQKPIDDQIVVRAGEKNRLVKVSFGTVPSAAPLAAAGAPGAAPVVVPQAKPPSPVAYVLGGVGIVGMIGWAYFGLTGTSDAHTLRATCAPNCSTSAVSHVNTKLALADAGMAVGIAGIVSGGIVFLATRRGGPSAPDSEPEPEEEGFLKHLDVHPDDRARGRCRRRRRCGDVQRSFLAASASTGRGDAGPKRRTRAVRIVTWSGVKTAAKAGMPLRPSRMVRPMSSSVTRAWKVASVKSRATTSPIIPPTAPPFPSSP